MKKLAISAALLLAALPLTAGADTTPAVPATPVPTTAAPAGAPITLRYKFTAGQILRYKLTMDMDGKLMMGPSGTAYPLVEHMEMVMRQSVKSVSPTDGSATIVSSLESMTGTMNGRRLPASVTAGETGKALSTLVMTPSGKVLSVQMQTPPTTGGAPGMDLSNLGLSQSGNALPDGPAKVGDAWKNSVTTGMAGIQMQVASTLTGVETSGGKNVADVAQNLSGTFDMTPKGTPVPMTIQGTMTGTGVLKFDADAGAIGSQTSTSQMNMTANVKPAPGTAGAAPAGAPTSFKMNFKINSDMERLPDSGPAVPAAPAPTP